MELKLKDNQGKVLDTVKASTLEDLLAEFGRLDPSYNKMMYKAYIVNLYRGDCEDLGINVFTFVEIVQNCYIHSESPDSEFAIADALLELIKEKGFDYAKKTTVKKLLIELFDYMAY